MRESPHLAHAFFPAPENPIDLLKAAAARLGFGSHAALVVGDRASEASAVDARTAHLAHVFFSAIENPNDLLKAATARLGLWSHDTLAHERRTRGARERSERGLLALV